MHKQRRAEIVAQQLAEEAPNHIFQKLYLEQRTEIIEQFQILAIFEVDRNEVVSEINQRKIIDRDLAAEVRVKRIEKRSILRELNNQYNDVDYQKILKEIDGADDITIELENEVARLENAIEQLERQRGINRKICQALKLKKKVLEVKIFNAKRTIKEAGKVKTALSHDFIIRKRTP